MLSIIINLTSWLSLIRFYDFQVTDDRVSLFIAQKIANNHLCYFLAPKHFYYITLTHRIQTNKNTKQHQCHQSLYFSGGHKAGPPWNQVSQVPLPSAVKQTQVSPVTPGMNKKGINYYLKQEKKTGTRTWKILGSENNKEM